MNDNASEYDWVTVDTDTNKRHFQCVKGQSRLA